ncbi:hypothetical protein [Enterobacter roggenkampii]|uniref:hypothetical protein n=1 Tax=Enterobacter roggenkampii TaxID=1812935 RepID=UPI001FD7F98E|nr:hypothetical protein [Enterobacter roggenkampii]
MTKSNPNTVQRSPLCPNVAYAKLCGAFCRQEQPDGEPENQFIVVPGVLKANWSKDVFLRTLWKNLLLYRRRQPYTANFKRAPMAATATDNWSPPQPISG